MSQDRWARRRDELVQAGWLRDLRSRRAKRPVEAAQPPRGAKASVASLREQRVAAAER